MFEILIALLVIISVFLILVVLVQNPKGGGLSAQFGGSGTNQVLGVKKTGDLLEKMTWVFIVLIFAASIFANISKKNSLSADQNADQPDTELNVPAPSSPGIDTTGSTTPTGPSPQ